MQLTRHRPKSAITHPHTDESRGIKAFIRVCLSVCVCLFVRCPDDRTKTTETITTKLARGISIMSTGYTHLMLDQKVKGQGHRIIKCKKYISVEGDRVAGVTV